LLMWIVVSCVTFLLLSSLLACCLGSHPSQTSDSFSNQQHFGKELMPHRALVLLIAFRALPSVNCCLGLLFSSPLLLWIVICCDDLSIAIIVVILPLFAASKNRNEKSRRCHILDLVVHMQVAFHPPQITRRTYVRYLGPKW